MRFLQSITSVICLLLLAGCGKQEEKKSYFKRDEFKQGKTFRLVHHMSYDELKEEKAELLAANKKHIAIKFLAQMIKKCEHPEELRALRLEYANMLFDLGQYTESVTEYQSYVQYYPASEQAPYADFRAVESLFKQVSGADRDQEKTQELIDEAKEYAKKAEWHKGYEEYMGKVEDMTHDALKRLYESEVLRFYFYINRGHCRAAYNRLQYIKEKYVPYLDEIKPEVLELEFELACEKKDHKDAESKKQQMKKEYPKFVCDPGKKRRYASVFTL